MMLLRIARDFSPDGATTRIFALSFPLTSIRRPPPPHASLPRLRIRMGISWRRRRSHGPVATGRTVGKRALPGALPREVVLPVVLARRQVDLLVRHRCYKTLRDASVPV